MSNRLLSRSRYRCKPTAVAAANALRFAATSMRGAQLLGQDVLPLPNRALSFVSGTTAQATVDSTATMYVGQLIRISGATPSGYNATSQVLSIPSGTTFTYTVASNPGVATVMGTANLRLPTGALARVTGITSLTSSGTTATLTFSSGLQGITTGDTLFIYGSNGRGYNGLVTITSTGGLNTGGVGTALYTMSQTEGGVASSGHSIIQTKRRTFATELPLTLGSTSWSELRVLLPNWAHGSFVGNNTQQGIYGGTGGLTIDDCSVTIGSVSAQVFFGGSGSKTVLSTDAEVLSDAITAASVWLDSSGNVAAAPTFPVAQGTTVTIKAKTTCAAFNTYSANFNTSPANVSARYYQYCATDGNVVISSTLRPTSYSSSGTIYSNGGGYESGTGSVAFSPAFSLVGRPTSTSAKILFCTGDSIAATTGDNNDTDNTGATVANASLGRTGWFCRSLWDSAFTAATCYAGMNVAVPSNNATMYTATSPIGTSTTWFFNWMDYATLLVEEDGTNANDGGNNGTFQSASELLWSTARGKGLKVLRTSLMPQASSTDQFLTTGNQTPVALWNNGAAPSVGAFEARCQAAVGTLIDAYITFLSCRASGAADRTNPLYFIWVVDGVTTFYPTSDNLHPKPRIHVSVGQEGRAKYATM